MLSYLGGQQPVVPGSSVDRNDTLHSSVLRVGRRRKIDTINNSNETTFWASRRGAANQSALPPTIGTAIDRARHPRRYTEDDDRTEDLPRNGNVGFGRRNDRQEKGLSERRPDPATMAPHSSGALLSPRGVGREAEAIVGANHQAVDASKWWRGGGSRASSVQRAGFLGGEEDNDLGPGRGMEWDPYPDADDGDKDHEQQTAGRVSESHGVYKSARSKRRMSRNMQARAAKGSSLGDRQSR